MTSAAIFVLACAFVAAESLLLVYLPAHLALAQYRSPAMLWVASWAGIWGVSFVAWLAQLWLAAKLSPEPRPDQPVFKKTRPVGTWALLGVIAILGFWKHPSAPALQHDASKGQILVGAIQTTEPFIEKLLEWNADAKRLGAKLVVWPELSAIGLAAGGRTEHLIEYSRDPAQPAFVTTFPDSAQPKPHNAASIFFAGQESARYFKRKPFAAEAKEHQAGTTGAAGAGEGMQIGLNICFDSCYPAVVRDSATLDGVQIVALPCMGPESPYGVIQAIHGAFTPFRSAELGVPIVRGESSAFAMITDADGRIVAEAPAGFEGVIVGSVSAEPRWTLVRLLGDWFLYLCWAAVVLFSVFSVSSVVKKKQIAPRRT